jgi:amino acid transporter
LLTISKPDLESTPDAEVFFQQYLALPIVLVLYLGWKVYSRDWRMWIPAHEIDLVTGARMHVPGDDDGNPVLERTWKNLPKRVANALF